ncbi:MULTISPECIES: PKD domain-containing protein [Streptomyces]|uniref:PKD domain-containing protein n=1 Tax=Streptomyces TaxID=1883 RepID=UPI0004C014EA|nr:MULTISPECIES: right-handed parallel beta-helix repeat-containing protein [Streptomyces]
MNVGRLAALAGTSALLAAVVLPVPFAAAADAPGDQLTVDNSVACSDTGPASTALPLCTISAAAKIVRPGQTVVVRNDWAYTESVLINRSGAPGKPITFTTGTTGDPRTQGFGAYVQGSGTPAFTVKGATDVVIHGFGVHANTSPVVVADSSRVTIDHLYMARAFGPEPEIRVTGASDHVTVSRNSVNAAHTAAVQIEAGIRDTVVSTNYITGSDTSGIVVGDAPGTLVTSNSVLNSCGSGILLNGAATGSAVRNNIVTGSAFACTGMEPAPAIQVSPAAVPGTGLDYNLVDPGLPTGRVPYLWNGQSYPGPAELRSATGQGAHDLAGNPHISNGPDQGSPAIDSADADAPGILPTDYYGNSPSDDPGVANTGTGSGIRDRGAVERQVVTQQEVHFTGEYGPYPRPVTAKATLVQNWPAALSYSFDFGDGTAPVVTTQPTADHTYARAGTFSTTLTVTSPEGLTFPAVSDRTITVSEPAEPKAAFTVKPCSAPYSCGPLGYEFDTLPSTSSWPVNKVRLDFGDGSGTDLTSLQKGIQHNYPRPGDYTATLTFTNSGGQQATASQKVAVITKPAGFDSYSGQRALDTRQPGYGTPKLTPGQKLTIDLKNQYWPVSWDATAVVVNVTAVNAEGQGFLSLGPNDRPRPESSNLNYVPGAAIPNLVTVPVGNDFKIAVWNAPGGAAVDLVIDIEGEYTPRSTDLYAPLQPKRIMDSRTGTGVPAGKVSSLCNTPWPVPLTKLQVRGVNGVPNDATSVVLNVTATEPDQDGHLMVGSGSGMNSSNLNFKAGQTTSNQVVTKIADDGTIMFCNNAGSLHVIADLSGYYGPSGQHLFVATDPTRMLDTRVSPGKLGPYSSLAVSGLPTGATGAVLNVTATEPTADGFLAVYPGGTDRPDVSTVNFAAGQTVATHATVPVGADGTVNLYNHNGSTHALVDSYGYFIHR